MLSKFVVLSDPTPGREQEYNRWYEHEHLRDVLDVPGFVSAQRFGFASKINDEPHWSYCVIYTIDSDHPEKVVEELTRRVATGTMLVSSSLDPRVYAVLYRPVGEEQHSAIQ
jgi:hypothetical protein